MNKKEKLELKKHFEGKLQEAEKKLSAARSDKARYRWIDIIHHCQANLRAFG
jgi:hypothetical protein